MKLIIEQNQSQLLEGYTRLHLQNLKNKIEECKSENEAKETVERHLDHNRFFWGCGSSHLWIHAKFQATNRAAIIYF